MSVNPLSAGALPPNIAAIIAEELAALAADAQTLASQVSPGDIIPAVVLPSNGLTDLLSVNGLRVAAELPPSLVPGENITVLVTGFDGERINLQIVPTPPTEPNPSFGAAQPAPLRSADAAQAASPPVAPAAPDLVRTPPGSAPAPASPPAPAASAPAAAAGRASAASVPPAPAAAEATPPPRFAAAQPLYRPGAPAMPPVLKSIEARLATAHATATPLSRPPAPAPAPAPSGAKSVPVPASHLLPPAVTPRPAPSGGRPPLNPAAPPARPLRAADNPSPFGAKPMRADAARLPPGVSTAVPRPVIAARQPLQGAAGPAALAAPAAMRGPAAFTDPAALLRALHLPVTATNVAAARMALESPEKLPNALATLERALANVADPRVATLSTLVTFLARIDPRSPVLAAQIAAFADHVVTGREAKIAQLAGAVEETTAPAAPARSSADPERAPAAERQAEAPSPPLNARAAVVRAALDYDLKTQLLTVAAGRAAGTEAAMPKDTAFDRAIAGTLTAITALQLTAATTLSANPDGLAFTLPIALPDGFAAAHVRIDGDAAAGRKQPLDGDNFHIAFVLETRHLGVVAIDLMTVGRAVTLSVKTEAVVAQRVFAKALDRLTVRLEALRYSVAKADAAVAPPLAAEKPAPPMPGRPAEAARLVDCDA
ncbi:MAG: hypothetical protein ABSB70_13875 [Candidatus Velthaea sp.]